MVEDLFRQQNGRIRSLLLRVFGVKHYELVEDIVQDTFVEAIQRWRYHGLPSNPEAWLTTVAKNKCLNALKRERIFADNRETASRANLVETCSLPEEVVDSQLRLLFFCCSLPASRNHRVAFTLHAVGGLGVPEISRAMLMQQEAVKKVLYRVKQSLHLHGDRFEQQGLLQSEADFEEVTAVLYLMFNEGYNTLRGKAAIDIDLCYEALRLARLLLSLKPEFQSEAQALIALMYFHLSRFPGRSDALGNTVLLRAQDRTLWDHNMIREGYRFLQKSREQDQVSRYHIEAGIASVHCIAPSFEHTDWKTLVRLYDLLVHHWWSPAAAVNRALAVGYAQGPASGLRELQLLSEVYDASALPEFHAAQADLFQRQNQWVKACEAYTKACDLCSSENEKRILKQHISECHTRMKKPFQKNNHEIL